MSYYLICLMKEETKAFQNLLREAAKKVLLLVARPLRGGGLSGRATKKITVFFAASLTAVEN